MRLLWFRVLAIAQMLGGLGLIGWAALFNGLMGWGGGFSDLHEGGLLVLPWFAPLAIGPVFAARRSVEGRRRLARVTAVCVVAALAIAFLALIAFEPTPCPAEEAAGDVCPPPTLPWPLLILLVPLYVVIVFLAFVTLAIPVLAARTWVGRVAGWVPFALGFAIAAYPKRLVANDDLREWLFATTAMLVLLGVALVAVGIAALRARDSAASAERSPS